MEDRTKLVWLLEDKDLPFPPFEVYPCEQRNYDPMECPALELGPEEYANYTVHEVTKPCTVSLNARSADGAEFAVYCNGRRLGDGVLRSDGFSRTAAFSMEPAEMARIRIQVIKGNMQIKDVIFEYCE